VAFPVGKPEPASVRAIADWLQTLATGRIAPPATTALHKFDARAVAERQLDILSAAT
jgi:hypothetical protein